MSKILNSIHSDFLKIFKNFTLVFKLFFEGSFFELKKGYILRPNLLVPFELQNIYKPKSFIVYIV